MSQFSDPQKPYSSSASKQPVGPPGKMGHHDSAFASPAGYGTPVYSPQPPQETNSVGLIGFILSLCGLGCGLAFPIGLVISLFGLSKKPKGFAVAGTVIGAIGTLLTTAIVILYIAVFAAAFASFKEAGKVNETERSIQEARDVIESHRDADGKLPDHSTGSELIRDYHDSWEQPLRYELQGDDSEDFIIRSIGPDQELDTFDDIRSDELYGNTAEEAVWDDEWDEWDDENEEVE